MKKRKRLCGCVLTAALLLSMLSTAALAVGTALTVVTPKTVPRAGEEFSVAVNVTGNPGFCSVGFAVPYDTDKLECVDIRAGALLKGVMSAVNPDAQEGAKLGAASVDAINGDGTLAVLTFRAKEDLKELNLPLTQAKLSDGDGKVIGFTIEQGTEPDEPEVSGRSSGGGTAITGTTFPDAVGHWGAPWIGKAAERGLFTGDDKGNFRPDESISRGDYVLVLWRMAGKPEPKNPAPFADVAESDYFAKAVAWAAEQGYVNGKGNGFAPGDSLTRQEAMKILFGYAGNPGGLERMFAESYDKAFSDSAQLAPWAKEAMYWAYYKGIINGVSAAELGPTMTATRAQLAKILVEYREKEGIGT